MTGDPCQTASMHAISQSSAERMSKCQDMQVSWPHPDISPNSQLCLEAANIARLYKQTVLRCMKLPPKSWPLQSLSFESRAGCCSMAEICTLRGNLTEVAATVETQVLCPAELHALTSTGLRR